MKFRLLRADEIDCRISTCNSYGVGLLLYKDARCDMNILDETVGPFNWQRKHTRDNANCIVSIWDEKTKQWIDKEDTGTESMTEKEKGLASDSFKRACFNWGIGRELYTAPDMFVFKKDLKKHEETEWQGKKKWTCKDSFKVTEIEYDDCNRIVMVKVLNTTSKNEIVFGTSLKEEKTQEEIAKAKISTVKVDVLINRCKTEGIEENTILKLYKVNSLADLTEKQFRNINDHWEDIKKVG